MAPLLFINKSQQSSSLTRSTGKEKFLINRHVSRQHRKRLSKSTTASFESSDDNDVDLQAPSQPGEILQDQMHNTGHAIIRQINVPGQSVDPFGSTALRINPDACNMMAYFLTWTAPRDNVLTIEPDDTSLTYRVATVRPNEVVEKAISDDLHMASLLSYIICLMNAEQPGCYGSTRIWEVTNQALSLLRKRLQAEADSNMVFDILNLAYSALYLGETAAARKHIRALGDLVAFKGGYSVLAPHTLPSIMYADVCCSLPGLRSTIFDLSQHELPAAPPIPWVPVPSLHKEAQLVHLQLLQHCPHGQCRDYASHIVEMVQVLHTTRSDFQTQQSPNAYWVMLTCLTLLSNILAVFQKSIASSQGWAAVAFPTTNAVDSIRLETTRICLLLWMLLLRTVVWGPSASSLFLPPFEGSLLRYYRTTRFDKEIYTALSSWNELLRPSTKQLTATISLLSAAELVMDMAAVVTELEGTAYIQLGEFMSHFLHLEYRDGDDRATVNSLALITSNTKANAHSGGYSQTSQFCDTTDSKSTLTRPS